MNKLITLVLITIAFASCKKDEGCKCNEIVGKNYIAHPMALYQLPDTTYYLYTIDCELTMIDEYEVLSEEYNSVEIGGCGQHYLY